MHDSLICSNCVLSFYFEKELNKIKMHKSINNQKIKRLKDISKFISIHVQSLHDSFIYSKCRLVLYFEKEFQKEGASKQTPNQ